MPDDEDNNGMLNVSQEQVANDRKNPLHVYASSRESAQMAKDSAGEGEGVRLVRLLESRGLNKNRFAKKAGVSATAVNRWERGLNEGTAGEDMRSSIADALVKAGIEPSELWPDYRSRGRGKVSELLGPILAIENDEMLALIHQVLTVDSDYDREILVKLVETKLGRTR